MCGDSGAVSRPAARNHTHNVDQTRVKTVHVLSDALSLRLGSARTTSSISEYDTCTWGFSCHVVTLLISFIAGHDLGTVILKDASDSSSVHRVHGIQRIAREVSLSTNSENVNGTSFRVQACPLSI